MTHTTAEIAQLQTDAFYRAADVAVRAIPPVWPLASSVAVNPYLGQSGLSLPETAALLGRVSGQPMTMPRAWYDCRIADGRISDDDIRAALALLPADQRPGDVAAIKAAAKIDTPRPQALPTVADLAAQETGTDWPGLIAERIGHWAAGYFDVGQAHWTAPRGKGAYGAWRAAASVDLTPEIAGLNGFAQHVSDAPETARDAIMRAAGRLGLTQASSESYFHGLLMTLGGWAQVGRYQLWQAELAESGDTTGIDLLAIRLIWEEALYLHAEKAIQARWAETVTAHAAPLVPTPDQVIDGVLQEAADRGGQRHLSSIMATQAATSSDDRPAMQAAFCIDVRSEVYRRALESVDPGIETLGFAGFFGLTAAHRSFASDVVEKRLPVLLNPGVHSVSGDAKDAAEDTELRLSHRAARAWGRFKQAAVSSFAFVEAAGPIYAGKLVRDALGQGHGPAAPDPAPRLDPALDLSAQVDAAETILNAMSLTSGFARLVIVAGHGANVVNNPHASALHCGACGGYSGEVNARLLAGLLNSAEVRAGLAERGLEIPDDTLFVAGLHDTTTDEVTLYDKDQDISAHGADLNQASKWLAAAGRLSRAERALRLPRAAEGNDIAYRSRDWSETRPEWALAGCQAFVAAPRHRTKGKSLNGRSFLHDYDWKADQGFGVLELILTAPVVVASWISLQYYGSTVAPEAFGGGNKLLHNVTGGIGVVEGNGGVLRPGLPLQSVHDGEDFVHEPLRLSVCIEAPREAMAEILSRHDGVRDLFDNRWLHLFALDENGQMAWRYAGDLTWEPVAQDVAEVALKEAS